MIRVVIQQIVVPSPMLEPMVTENFLPRAAIFRKIVSDIMHLPADHPRVALVCVHVLAPCFLMLFNKHLVNRAFPSLDLSSQSTSEVVETVCRYALAGMKAVASGPASQPEQINK